MGISIKTEFRAMVRFRPCLQHLFLTCLIDLCRQGAELSIYVHPLKQNKGEKTPGEQFSII